MVTSCEELTHWKRLWCWEGLGAGGEGDNRGWDGWMASLIWWTWVWVNSRSWWWTGRPGMLRFMGSQRAGHDWATKLNWTGKTIALTMWTFVGKVMSQLFNMLWPFYTRQRMQKWDLSGVLTFRVWLDLSPMEVIFQNGIWIKVKKVLA